MIECVVRAMGRRSVWKDGGASGIGGFEGRCSLGQGGAVGLIAWVENAEREERPRETEGQFEPFSIQGVKHKDLVCTSISIGGE